jgi:hypothetical protein
MPACSSHWEAHQDGGMDETRTYGRGVAGIVWRLEIRWRPEYKPAQFSHAIPVSNRHQEELAR